MTGIVFGLPGTVVGMRVCVGVTDGVTVAVGVLVSVGDTVGALVGLKGVAVRVGM